MIDLLYACKAAYRKHVLDDDGIGWDELANILYNALANEIGDDEFIEWLRKINDDKLDTR